MTPLLVYGAYGYSGELIARRAVERGLRPILAGRDAGRLARLGDELGCTVRVFGLREPAEVRRGIEGVRAVLHCAGPFADTYRPVAEACLAAGAHYLDITGEIPVFQGIAAMGAEAERRGLMLLPGTGFDVVPSDCLAAHLVRRLPGATSIVLAFGGLDRPSRGTARTMLAHAGLVAPRTGARRPAVRTFDLGDGRPATAISIPWGDLVTAPRSTGVADVAVYMRASPSVARAMALVPAVAPLLRLAPVREAVALLMTRGASGPSAEERARGISRMYGEAHDGAGRRAAARLRLPDGYTLTAFAAVEVAERVLRGEVKPGWQTPASVYGPDLVLALPGCSREDV